VLKQIKLVFISVMLLLLPIVAQQMGSAPRAKVVSPHGNMNMACENCHTFTAWRPIRNLPDFDHNKTKYPLRGMHADVSCKQCHTSLVFSNVGMKCADCHADIHRRQMGANCEQCHTVKGWRVSTQSIKQHQNRFPLVGAHASVDCESCHKGAATGQYIGLSTQCISCHMKDYQTPVLDHKALGFPSDCTVCHTMNSWLGAKFDHAKYANFPLTGVHATLDCQSCHANNNFKGVSANCFSCHAKDFNGTTNPNHVQAGFPHDCGTCHSTASWLDAKFDHSTTKFPLTGSHAQVQCVQCHVNGKFASTPTTCASCHIDKYNQTTNPNHKAAAIPTDCSVCHTTTDWNGAKFDHTKYTKFALTGLHVNVACEQCHVGGKYTGTATDCASCHIKDYNGTTNPNHKASGFPTTCDTCHTTKGWQNSTFDHAKTAFPLTGFHTQVRCAQCHVGGKYAGTSTACASCHIDKYNQTTDPNHKAAGFPTDCSICHTTVDWSGAKFDHSKTKFPLTGQHVNAACLQCHVGGKYAGTSTDCASCHIANYNKTTDPNHAATGIPTTCAVCHNTSGWQPATFDHSITKFPLTGLHTSVACAQCHVNAKYVGLPTDCASCHMKDYNGTTDPNHKTSGFPTDCTICHTTKGWQLSTFNHSTTGFPLTGVHASTQCASCHVNGNYNLTSTACVTCHQADYNGTTNPNHKTSNIPTDCSLCHTTTGWDGAKFDHTKYTIFPLTGKHVNVACLQCHVGGKYAGTATDCASCHISDYNGTTNPNHKTGGFPTTCATCHTTAGWQPATFDHSMTKFPLTGLHTTVTCALCHVNNNYTSLPTTCSSCHINDYNGTTNPNHKASGFPTDCTICHTTQGWQLSSFNHSTTGFPLTGFHTSLPCSTCHVNGNFSITTNTCVSCHQGNYNGTTNPNHKAAGFPTTCEVCHSTTAWTPATFDHNKTPFPLTGAHVNVACAKCHINNVYAGTPTDCYACHKADYTGVTNPNHVAANFPTTCTTCHTTTAWTGAVFNHTWFPIYSGTHNGKWTTCADCHVNRSDFSAFSCITCHQHAQSNTDPDHRGVRNYVYGPTTCYSCHANGRAG
jgi:hypothetical protein